MTEMSAEQLADRVVRSLKENSAAFRRRRERQFALADGERSGQVSSPARDHLDRPAAGLFRLASHWLRALRNRPHL
jgi:hypothetical protein